MSQTCEHMNEHQLAHNTEKHIAFAPLAFVLAF